MASSSNDCDEIMFSNVKRNIFHVAEIKSNPIKRHMNKSSLRSYILMLSKSIDIEENNTNVDKVTDILLDSINRISDSEDDFNRYCEVSINFMPLLIKRNIYFSTLKWSKKHKLSFFFPDGFSSRMCDGEIPLERVSFDSYL